MHNLPCMAYFPLQMLLYGYAVTPPSTANDDFYNTEKVNFCDDGLIPHVDASASASAFYRFNQTKKVNSYAI